MYNNIIKLFNENHIEFKEYNHEPILDYEKAKEIGKRLGFEGIESKSLFLKGKCGNYFVFVTVEGTRLDSKLVKKIIGERVSVCSSEELTKVTNCIPGCVSPFGYDDNISLIIDRNIFNYDKFIFSPGVGEITLIISVDDIHKILDTVHNKIFYYR